ncbi:MAG: endonuclease III [Spirochaetia bacterium]|jgi:endonuclease-3
MPGSRRAGKPETGKPGKPPAAEETARARKIRAKKIARKLGAAYPDARCMLDHTSPFELLVATILAAQCTDERVNMVTPALFRRFPTPQAMAAADIEELEGLIRSTGFFHNKAKSIKGASQALASRFSGNFPSTMDDLLTLPGVGRKTANVVRGTCFGAASIVVDTHFRRVTQRLGLAKSNDPDEIERELAALLPPEDWTGFSHAVTFHGRRCCAARKPDHAKCPVADLCDSRDI